MTLEPEIVEQLVEIFGHELEEQLQHITDDLLRLEKGVEAPARPAVYESIFRAAHNIKGAAAGVGSEAVAGLSHRLESLFSRLKRENTPPQPELVDACLHVLDGIRQVQRGWRFGEPLPAEHAAIAARLEQRLAAVVAGESVAAPAPVPAPESSAASAQPARAQGPGHGEHHPERPGADLVRVDLKRLDLFTAQSEELETAKVELFDHLERLRGLEQRFDLLLREWRVGLARVDEALPGSAEEARTALRHAADSLKRLRGDSRLVHRGVRTTVRQVGRLSAQLQANARLLRLVRAASLLRPLTRSVRDLAREIGKRVDFEVHGDETELDRAVLEGLKDPLTHLLRNAVDHGIEDEAARRGAGKPPQGHVRLAVESSGGRVRIRVEDDGAGIDPERVVRLALDKQLISAEEARNLDRRARLDLIFRPGFTSKVVVTQVSGRGVGLDVVKANIQALKGGVHVESEPGKGTRFVLDLPLTLATDQGLVVRVGEERFAISSAAVVQVMEVAADATVSVEASEAVLFQGRPYPLVELAAVLERPGRGASARDRKLAVVLVAHGWNAVAFLVDDIVGDREMVVKRLQKPLLAVRNVSGATVTGSGEIMMVLNAADLVNSALARAGRAPAWLGGEEEGAAPSILVVDDSITTRTLERRVLEKHGYRVSVASHGSQAWELLQSTPVDLVITDVQMPLMDGFELTGRIRQSERLRRLPVILVTSLGSEQDKQRGIQVGADAYIVKAQFDTRALLDLVRQLI